MKILHIECCNNCYTIVAKTIININQMGRIEGNVSSNRQTCKIPRFRFIPYMRRLIQAICSPLIHSIVSNDSVRGKRRPWSDCADAQADLGLRCPHMLEDTFSHGVTQNVIHFMRFSFKHTPYFSIYPTCSDRQTWANVNLDCRVWHTIYRFFIRFFFFFFFDPLRSRKILLQM